MNNSSHQGSLPARFNWLQFILLWLAGLAAAYFITGFLSNFYSSPYQFILLSLISQITCGLFSYLLIHDAFQDSKFTWHEHWAIFLFFCLAVTLGIVAVIMSWQVPGLFDRRILFMNPSMFTAFSVLAIPSMAGSAFILSTSRKCKTRLKLNDLSRTP
jgi:hypothetical protein